MLSVRPSLLGIVTFLILLEYFSSNKNIVGSILFYISHKFLTMFGLNSCNKHFCEGGSTYCFTAFSVGVSVGVQSHPA